jgi:hypothetical protein
MVLYDGSTGVRNEGSRAFWTMVPETAEPSFRTIENQRIEPSANLAEEPVLRTIVENRFM